MLKQVMKLLLLFDLLKLLKTFFKYRRRLAEALKFNREIIL
jgi:hypothetical protein